MRGQKIAPFRTINRGARRVKVSADRRLRPPLGEHKVRPYRRSGEYKIRPYQRAIYADLAIVSILRRSQN